MMQHWQIALFMMLGYLVIALVIGISAGMRKKSSLNEFVVAGRQLGIIVTLFLVGGTIFSAFAFLGGPGWAYEKGAPALYILVYSSFGILPWYIFGPKVGRIGKKLNLYTLSGFLYGRFPIRFIPILVGIISFIAFIQYLATQMKGMAYIFNIMTEGHVPFWLGALLAYGIVVLYVATGGLRAAAWSDVFQGMLMIIIAWVVGITVVIQLHGSSGEMFTSIQDAMPGFLEIGHQGSNMSMVGYVTIILVSIFGFMIWPHNFSKSYVTQPRTIKKIVVIYPLFSLFLIPILLAGFAAVGVVDMGTVKPDEILPHLVVAVMNLPGWLYGLVGAGALAAAMSSADAITHSASLEFTNGLIFRIWPRQSDEKTLIVIRITVVAIGAFAYFLTIFGPQSVIELLLGGFGSVVQFAPAVVGALFWKRATAPAVIVGILAGSVINYYYQFFASSTPLDIDAGILGLIVNTVLFVVISYVTKPHSKEEVDAYLKSD